MFTWTKKFAPSDAAQTMSESAPHKEQGDMHLRRSQLDDAARCYRHAVSINPAYSEAHINLGFVLREQGKYSEAEQHLTRAISINPNVADAYYVLGTVLRDQNDQDAAIRNFTKALDLKPDFEAVYPDLCFALFKNGQLEDAKHVIARGIAIYPNSAQFQLYLGNLLSQEQDYEHALACFKKGLAIEPTSPELHNNLGNVLFRQGKISEAIDCYELAVATKPDHVAALLSLGNAYLVLSAPEKALTCFQQVIKLEPENSAVHLVAALSGNDPERASSQYLEQLFDQFADGFDSHMVQALRYNIPEQLVDLIRRSSDPPVKGWNILDLGCGTGLVGSEIALYARQLVGVDLSAKMLVKAKARNLYHRLEQSDLLPMMRSEAASGYDVVIAADVFVYLGKLDELVIQVRRLLRPAGLFAFSVEALEPLKLEDSRQDTPGDYRLNHSGRYAHSIAYLRRIASDACFDVEHLVPAQGRLDRGEPVQAYLALWHRPLPTKKIQAATAA